MRRNSIIEKLCASHTALQRNAPKSEEVNQAFVVFCNHAARFRSKLQKYPELLREYDKVNRVQGDWARLEANDNFVEGFRLGVLLGLDLADKGNDEEEADE